MNKINTRINMNKVIIIGLVIVIFFTIAFILLSINKYNRQASRNSNRNEYSSNGKVLENNEIKKEEKTISHFENIENEVDTYIENQENKKLSTKAKEKFTELVDFIFYGTEINGITFNELSDSTKDKLISIVNRIDTKIESKVPGYKETISDEASTSYKYLSEKLKQGITYIDGKVEDKIGEEKYSNIKEGANKIVENVKEKSTKVLDKGKEIANSAKDKVKNWYEEWK